LGCYSIVFKYLFISYYHY